MIFRHGVAKLALLGSVLVALAATGAGVQRALPVTPEIDEPVFVQPAVRIAATGNLDPGWFGHPGATVIYPLAAFYRLAGSDVERRFAQQPQDFYLAGRWLGVAYQVLAIPLVFAVGRIAFGATAGVIGAWLTAILPIAVAHAQIVRTDSAAIFFGLLGLWLMLRAFDQPTRIRLAIAGMSVGLAVATRYFMVALVPIALLTARRRAPLTLAAVAGGFLAMSPFALLDLPALRTSLLAEAESSHVGADGLSPFGNLGWYVSSSLPDDLTWPVAALAAAGVGLSLWRRSPRQLLLVVFVAVYVVGISTSALHWHRWTIQVLPLLALFAGYALQNVPSLPAAALGTLVASVQLAAQLVLFDLQQLQPSPRVLARAWLVEHSSPRTGIVSEGYGPPLEGTRLNNRVRFSLSEQRLDSYAGYVVASSAVYDRYFAEPTRYVRQVEFYEELFGRGQLQAEFHARVPGEEVLRALGGAECNCSLHPTRGAPSLRIYAVGPT